jgi:hypothetical protein
MLYYATQCNAAVGRRRLASKLRTHAGLASLGARCRQGGAEGGAGGAGGAAREQLLSVCLGGEAAAALGAAEVLLDGEVGGYLSAAFAPAPAAAAGTAATGTSTIDSQTSMSLHCLMILKISLPWVLAHNANANANANANDSASSGGGGVGAAADKGAASASAVGGLHVRWVAAFLQRLLGAAAEERAGGGGVGQGSIGLFPAALACVAPLADLLLLNGFFLSEGGDDTDTANANVYASDSVSRDAPGVRLAYLLVGVLHVVLSREYGSVLDAAFSAAVRTALHLTASLCRANDRHASYSNSSGSGSGSSGRAKAAKARGMLSEDLSRRLLAPLQGVLPMLAPLVAAEDDVHLSASFSGESSSSSGGSGGSGSEPLAICVDAVGCLSNITRAALSLSLSPEADATGHSSGSMGNMTNMNSFQISRLLGTPACAAVRAVDAYLTRLPACEDCTANHWYKVVFWLPFLRAMSEGRGRSGHSSGYADALSLLLMDCAHSVAASWLACLATLHALVPRVHTEIRFREFHHLFRTAALQADRWRQGNPQYQAISDKNSSNAAMIGSLCDAFGVLGDYCLSTDTPATAGTAGTVTAAPNPAAAVDLFSPTARLCARGSDAALCLAVCFSCVAERAFLLNQDRRFSALAQFRRDNAGFVEAVDRCVRYLRIRSSDSSLARGGELSALAHTLAAGLVGELAYAVPPHALGSGLGLARDVSKQFQEYICKAMVGASRGRGRGIAGYGDGIPLGAALLLPLLPMYISGVCLTPFSTEFAEWRYLLHLAAAVMDGDSSALTDRVLATFARSVVAETSTVKKEFREKLEKELHVTRRVPSSPFATPSAASMAAYCDDRKTGFRRYLISTSAKWVEFCIEIKGVSTKPVETLSIIRSRFCAYTFIEIWEFSKRQKSALASARSSDGSSSSVRVSSSSSVCAWREDLVTVLAVSSIAAMQLLRAVCGHAGADISRLRAGAGAGGAEAGRQGREGKLLSSTVFSALRLVGAWRSRANTNASTNTNANANAPPSGADPLSPAALGLSAAWVLWTQTVLQLILAALKSAVIATNNDATRSSSSEEDTVESQKLRLQLKEVVSSGRNLQAILACTELGGSGESSCPGDLISELQRHLRSFSGAEQPRGAGHACIALRESNVGVLLKYCGDILSTQ